MPVSRPRNMNNSLPKRRLASFWPLTCLLLVLLRPLESADFWGLLAAGRETLSPATATTATNLSTPHTMVHWLGGLPWYLLWQTSELTLLQWVPILAGSAVLLALRSARSHTPADTCDRLLVPLLLLCLRPALQPGYCCNALFCLLVLQRLIQSRGSVLATLAIPPLVLLWANFGPLSFWGVLWLFTNHKNPNHKWCRRFSLAGAPVALMLRPGGLQAIYTDLREFTAGLDPVWRIWQSEFPDTTAAAASPGSLPFLLLSVAVLFQALVCRGGFSCGWLLRYSFSLIAAILNPSHIPLAALSIVLIQHEAGAANAEAMQWRRFVMPSDRFVSIAVVLLILPWLLLDACGCGGLSKSRIGWGSAQVLDLRLLDIPQIAVASNRPRVWAADRRAAGIAAWRSDAVELVGDPHSAFQAGDLTTALQLLRDLREGRRAAYRRTDGSQGGWHRQLRKLHVDLLLVPVEYQRLNEELQRSTWKVIDLDSPHVLWASSEAGAFTDAIRESAAQQNFVQWGAWQPDSTIYDPVGARTDLCTLFGTGLPPQPAIRQSTLFRTLRLPLAAVRSLLPLHRNAAAGWMGHSAICRELQNCHQDLAEFERDNYGAPATWRLQLLHALADRSGDAAGQPQAKQRPPVADQTDLSVAARQYADGELDQALQTLQRADANSGSASVEKSYATAMVLLEQGNLQSARGVLQQLVSQSDSSNQPHATLLLAAKGWLDLTAGPGGE